MVNRIVGEIREQSTRGKSGKKLLFFSPMPVVSKQQNISENSSTVLSWKGMEHYLQSFESVKLENLLSLPRPVSYPITEKSSYYMMESPSSLLAMISSVTKRLNIVLERVNPLARTSCHDLLAL